MKLMLTRKDNDEALDSAYQELLEKMDGRMASGMKPKAAPAPELEGPAEDQVEESDEGGPSAEELDRMLEDLG